MLTSKQTLFVEEYAKDRNGTQAAIRAGYSSETAPQAASRLLNNVKVRAHLNRIETAVAERTEITVASITTRLLAIADKAEKQANAPGFSVARQSLMDAAKLNGLVVETHENISRDPAERLARLATLKAERERLARTH